jgi:hypothetical protein
MVIRHATGRLLYHTRTPLLKPRRRGQGKSEQLATDTNRLANARVSTPDSQIGRLCYLSASASVRSFTPTSALMDESSSVSSDAYAMFSRGHDARRLPSHRTGKANHRQLRTSDHPSAATYVSQHFTSQIAETSLRRISVHHRSRLQSHRLD